MSLAISTAGTSQPTASQEPPTPSSALHANTTLPDIASLTTEPSDGNQNAIVLQWMKARGLHESAKRLEEEIRSGRAGTEPVVIVNDSDTGGADSEGGKDGKDSPAETLKQATNRRMSTRLQNQAQKPSITPQELVKRTAPRAATAAQASSSNAAASSSTALATGKKGARGKSPVAKSPSVSTQPNLKGTLNTSVNLSKAGAAARKSPTPSSAPATPDLTQLYSTLAPLMAAGAPGASQTKEESQTTTASLMATLNRAGMTIDEAMAKDPTDKQQGYRDLEAWVDGALDMYRPEFRPILFPVFVHFYLELILDGFKTAATHFFETYSPSLMTTHTSTLQQLSTITLPHHVNENELAQRFRNEKYVIRMSRSGFGLMLGWLMEGSGGEAAGAGEGFGGDSNKRGRAAVRRILNDRINIDVTTASSTEVPESIWEENTGLLSSLVPPIEAAANATISPTALSAIPSPIAYNKARGQLKLGPAPLQDGLAEEAKRVLREEPDPDVIMADGVNGVEPGTSSARRRTTHLTSADATLVNPEPTDLLPRSFHFKSIDVKREVEKVRDARKRIRLEPVGHSAADYEMDRTALFARSGTLPSVCAYTFHDAPDGVCSSIFSQDSTLLAAGFSESYIRIWSLRGDKLKGLRSDFNPSQIKDGSSMKKVRDKHGSNTRKLIGHSAPVYSLSFDPISGSAGPPKYLLSASADATVRLWSMETMTNVVAYRGHQNPVWDVQWSPMGIYFATGSRDRTARLWSTDRVAPLRMFVGHMSDVDCVRFHPNSLYLATGSSDMTCRLWDVQRGVCMRVFMGHKGPVTTMAMSPDGKYLASASTDLSIILWDLSSGRQAKKMTGHTSLINSLSFSACSSMLVSGSCDWTVRCWDVKGPGGARGKKGSKDEIEVEGFGLASRGSLVSLGTGLGGTGASQEGKLPEGTMDDKDNRSNETADLVATFPTKRTPVVNAQFTPRNLCMVSGYYVPEPEQVGANGP
ncbi:Transcription initiation factor TFIID subunit 5 [Tulasnella sp. 332]|nr:Transcription initiation factor TFIID subunit 5 [Tulasnella sp. 332]